MPYAQGAQERLPVHLQPPQPTKPPITRSIEAYYYRDPAPAPTTDTRLLEQPVEPAQTGSENPLAAILPEGAGNADSPFSLTYFAGTDHEVIKTAFIEKQFATWDEFVEFVLKKHSEGKRWAPEHLDGLLSVPVNGGIVLEGHSRNFDQEGPFTPIQDILKAGGDPSGMIIPLAGAGGITKWVRVTDTTLMGPDPDTGINQAHPMYYQVWVEAGHAYGITCVKDITRDGETDVFVRFGLEPVTDSALADTFSLN